MKSGAREGDGSRATSDDDDDDDNDVAGDAGRRGSREDASGTADSGLVDPLERLEPGTNVLVSGPSMVGKVALGYRLLAPAADAGRATFVVATSESADRARERYADHVQTGSEPLSVVDCMTRQAGLAGDTEEDDRTWFVSSPGDLTGLGMALSKALEATSADRRPSSRLLFDSVSTLLLYSDVETVYRFLHAALGRTQAIDGYGLYVLHTDALDDQTEATVTQLFDAVIEVREAEGTAAEYRLTASSIDADGWHRFEFDGGEASEP